MKKTLQEEKQRILQIMKQLNEQAFNDAGEPLMTHQQYRDYSEPSEPDYESDEYRNAPDREPTEEDIVDQVMKHFNTILYSYGGTEYLFVGASRNYGHDENFTDDLMMYFENNSVVAKGPDGEEFGPENIEDLHINDLFDFFEPYRKYMMPYDEAAKYLRKEQDDNARDQQYAY